MSIRDEVQPGERWEFGQDVADAFDDMLERSIPQYDVMRRTVFELGSRFVQHKTAIVDLGCARGEALAPFVAKFGAQNRYVGVEISEPMARAAMVRFAPEQSSSAWDGGWLVQIRQHDLRDRSLYPPETASLALAVLTLQFVPIEHRLGLLGRIRASLAPGGALVVVEKVIGSSPLVDDALRDLYHDHKRAMGYTEEQIVRKAAALEGVLVPVTAEMNVEMIRSAGFHPVECFWRWANFAGWVAVAP